MCFFPVVVVPLSFQAAVVAEEAGEEKEKRKRRRRRRAFRRYVCALPILSLSSFACFYSRRHDRPTDRPLPPLPPSTPLIPRVATTTTQKKVLPSSRSPSSPAFLFSLSLSLSVRRKCVRGSLLDPLPLFSLTFLAIRRTTATTCVCASIFRVSFSTQLSLSLSLSLPVSFRPSLSVLCAADAGGEGPM